jgi:hypothetical protein
VARLSLAHWLTRISRGRARFDPSVAANRIPEARVRPLSEGDIETCCELYALNEPGRFPAGYLPEFRKALQSPSYLFLVIEAGSRLVGLGGICRVPGVTVSNFLVFGMVHPARHGQGFGPALLLARLSVISRPDPEEWIFLSSGGGSDAFYRRFGFRYRGRFPTYPNMQLFDVYRSYLTEADWKDCAEILDRSKVTFDRDGVVVPVGPALPDKPVKRELGSNPS